MKTLATIIFSAFFLFACETAKNKEEDTKVQIEKTLADTIKKDSLKVEKRSLFPKDDEETEKMDEIVNRAKKQKL